MCHKTCRRHRSRISSAGVKLSSPPPLLSALTAVTSCRGVPRPVSPCMEVCGVWDMCSREQIPCSSCGQLTHRPSARKKGSPSLGPGKRWVGARSTVAHKRISPPHKDSGPLLSLTRSTKEVTFVCLAGRRGCGRTGQPGGSRSRRRWWHWWWGYNDRRGG